jgi:hypothetical protein
LGEELWYKLEARIYIKKSVGKGINDVPVSQ